jgi:protein-arginine kinase activator protein McsA
MKTCKNCKQDGFIQLFKGYCTDCFYKCALCEKCQEWHKVTEDDFLNVNTRGKSYREPAEHFKISFEQISSTTAMRLTCPECDMYFRHGFDWDEGWIKGEGCIVIARETE